MPTLAGSELEGRLAAMPGWEAGDGCITRRYRFDGFPAAVGFVVRLAFAAEAADHHPDVDIRYDRVLINLSTHSEGGVTEKDLALAATADRLADG